MVPIGPRRQRIATAASPKYLARRGSPSHPRDLLEHACIRTRFPGGALTEWTFETETESLTIDPSGPLTISTQAAEFAIKAAIDRLGGGHDIRRLGAPRDGSGTSRAGAGGLVA